MPDIHILGLRISVYTRIARLALEEKGVPYTLDEVDIFADAGPPAEYLVMNPFGTIPSLRYGEFELYETSAITRWVDDGFSGPALQPKSALDRARMNQAIGILDSYAYRPMVWDVYVQRSVVPASGGSADEEQIAAALPRIRAVLEELDRLGEGKTFLLADELSLADLHAYPMLRYLVETPEGRELLDRFPRLSEWLQNMAIRPSVRATSFHWAEGSEDGF